MTNEELADLFRDRITDPLELERVAEVNHRPHPFVVGSRHVAYAADRCGGILGEEALRAVCCAHRNCNLSYDEHTSDRVMFLKLTRNCTQAEIKAVLVPIADEVGATGVDGFAFVETEEGYRISKFADQYDEPVPTDLVQLQFCELHTSSSDIEAIMDKIPWYEPRDLPHRRPIYVSLAAMEENCSPEYIECAGEGECLEPQSSTEMNRIAESLKRFNDTNGFHHA